MKPSKFFQFLIFFVGIWAILNLLNGNKTPKNTDTPKSDIEISTIKKSFSQGSIVTLNITNNKTDSILPWADCPSEPLDVYRWDNGEWNQIRSKETKFPCDEKKSIASNQSEKLEYSNWNHDLFNQIGRYKIVYQDGYKEFPVEFEIKAPSFFKQVWNSLFYKPIYNGLIFLTSVLPGHSLGWAIVLITILIKLLLLGPNHKALKSQKALQKIQPELDKVKKKHTGDQQKIAQETMAIWKKHKVNPMGSCLPMLIQFPIMIAVFYVVKTGLLPSNTYLLYGTLQNFDLSLVNPNFLGILDLSKINTFALPLIVGGLQFFQMKLSFSQQQKKKKEKSKSKSKANQGQQMQMMNKMMTYSLPIMIAFFTATMPAGVGLYWGISTLFGIAQQLYINKKH